MGDDSQIIAKLKAELLARNYQGPETLNGKDRQWLERELRLVKSFGPKPQDNKT
jgi:hypothetical protein